MCKLFPVSRAGRNDTESMHTMYAADLKQFRIDLNLEIHGIV